LAKPADVNDEYAPLGAAKAVAGVHLPVQLTTFVGREKQITEVRSLLGENRLLTLTGCGGVGKTRLAVQVAAHVPGEFGAVWFVDLGPITDPNLVPLTVAGTLGLPDHHGRDTLETIAQFLANRRALLLLDNCEHLLDACAALIPALLGDCPRLSVLATSREPIGIAGELVWRVPALPIAEEAVELFSDRAGRTLPAFAPVDENIAIVTDICRRLDGLPLAIELAAARARTLSLSDIADGLDDRFRLLTGGWRNASPRQQTLRASTDWSHALLTESERTVFRRLSVFVGGFDLDGAEAVGGGGSVPSVLVLDVLTSLVDKSLVVAENRSGRTRYRLLDTMRQYALEKLGESGEADAVRDRHCKHFAAMAVALDVPWHSGYEKHIERVDIEVDNLRAAFHWSRQNVDVEVALRLASSLQPLWRSRGRHLEGLAWFDATLSDLKQRHAEVPPASYARALADRAELAAVSGAGERLDQAELARMVAEEHADPTLLARALTACGGIAALDAEVARPYFAEAIGLAREVGDKSRLCETLCMQALAVMMGEGDPIAARPAAEEARDIADLIADRQWSRTSRWLIGFAQFVQGELDSGIAQLHVAVSEAEAAGDVLIASSSLATLSQALTYRGERDAARAAAEAALDASTALGLRAAGHATAALAIVSLACRDITAAADTAASAVHQLGLQRDLIVSHVNPQIAWARGDLNAARRWADEAISCTRGAHRARALTTRARTAIAQGDPAEAARDAYEALKLADSVGAYLGVPDILECLATSAGNTGIHRHAARLFGAAAGVRQRTGALRFAIYDAAYATDIQIVRDGLSGAEFESAWNEGAALSLVEAVEYAKRGRGGRKRPSAGWAALTPTELDVVRLVCEGFTNKTIATKLFMSPRTVQTHLTHVYSKLDITSRVQLVREAEKNTHRDTAAG
jgi:predicted ATPase/DNA-binding CsgD family transcriptional regulator